MSSTKSVKNPQPKSNNVRPKQTKSRNTVPKPNSGKQEVTSTKKSTPPPALAQPSVRPVVKSPPSSKRKAISTPSVATTSQTVSHPGDSQKWMEEHNDWFRTLLHPSTEHGVKIPDMAFQETGTFTTVVRMKMTTTSAGVGSFVAGGALGPNTVTSIVPNITSCALGNGGTMQNVGFAVNSTTTTDSAPFSIAAGAAGLTPYQYPTEISSIASQLRVVSCGVQIEPATSATTDQGVYAFASLPTGFFSNREGTFISTLSTNDVFNLPNAQISPINKGAINMRWAPTDTLDVQFRQNNSDITTNSELIDDYGIGSMVCVISGAAASQAHYITIVTNFEYLPTTGTLMIGISKNYSDSLAIDYAMNHIQDIPLSADSDTGYDSLSATGFPSESATVPLKTEPNVLASHLFVHSQQISLGGRRNRNKPPPLPYRPPEEKPAKRGKPTRRSARPSTGKTVFEKLLSMVLPMAKKVVPTILSMI